MTDEPENLILRQLRAMDVKLDRVLIDLRDNTHRLGRVELQLADVNVQMAHLSVRLDRVVERLEIRTVLIGTTTP